MREREITMNGLAIPGLTSGVTQVGDVSLHHWSGGDPDGTPVLLWHGFVETSYGWRVVAPILVEAGCSVLIPDMRGYGDSDKPEGTAGYDARSLANEFRGLVAATGFGGSRPLVIAAHDMGAPPALIWAADHPQEVQTLVYIDEPVMLGEVIRGLITYQPQQANRFGSLWWWTLPFAPGAAEKIIVGNERGWLEWFYEFGHSNPPGEVIDEYLRTFSGREGVLGALGVYRAGFTTIEQTEPLAKSKVQVPVTAVGGAQGLGAHVAQMLGPVATDVTQVVIEECGHFALEDQPERLANIILDAIRRTADLT
jgi:pimeloyl-ACP methyl ester carboxylesterase